MRMMHRILKACHRRDQALFLSRSVSQLLSPSYSSGASFGIAFDIDGVLIRGNTPIGGSPTALKRLYDPSGFLRIPYVFLTNGGGVRECKRAAELSELFGVSVLPSQVLHGHLPFKHLVSRFENEFVVAVGKGEPVAIMSDYGFKDVILMDDYVLCFDDIDPLAPHKKWTVNRVSEQIYSIEKKNYARSDRVQAIFIVSDPVDWGRDIQVICDILRSGGLPGREAAVQPHLYFAHDDLKYQGAFPTERFGMGAFRIALQSVFNSIHPHPLQYSAVGKPNPLAFKNAETSLQLLRSLVSGNQNFSGVSPFKTLYMIGDNPLVDIKGANQAGHPWFSILTRTGVFRGKQNDDEFPADMVVDTVEEAVNFILEKESSF